MSPTFEDTNNRYSLLFDLVDSLSSDESSSPPPSPSPSTSLFDLPRNSVGQYSPKELIAPDSYPLEDHTDGSDVSVEEVEHLYSDDITPAFLKAIGVCHCFNAETGEQVENFLAKDVDGKRHERGDGNAEDHNETALSQFGSKGFESFSECDEVPPVPPVTCSTPLITSLDDHISFCTPEKLQPSAYPDSDLEDADEVPRSVGPASQITARMDFDATESRYAQSLPGTTQRMDFVKISAPLLPLITPRMEFGAESGFGNWSDARCNDGEVNHKDGGGRDPELGESSSDSELFFTPFHTPFASRIAAQNPQTTLIPQSPITTFPRHVCFQEKAHMFSTMPSSAYGGTSPVKLPPSPPTSGKFPGTYSSPTTFITPPRLTLKEKCRVKPSPTQLFDDSCDSDVENIIEEIERANNSYGNPFDVYESERERNAKILNKESHDVRGGVILMLMVITLGLIVF